MGAATDLPSNTSPKQPRWQQGSMLALAALTASGILYALVAAGLTRQNTGVINIDVADNKAKISANQLGSATKLIGTGNTSVRLHPGTYQITAATTDQGMVSKVVEVVKNKTISLSLQSEAPVQIHRIANYRAQDIFTSDNTLHFLNTAEGVPYIYNLGSSAGRPYMASLSGIRSLHWLNPTQLVTKNSHGNWEFTSDSHTEPLTYNGKSPEFVDFNKQNNLVLIAKNKDIATAPNITTRPQAIGSAKHINTKASLAPNGSIVIYTPDANTSEPSRLYQNGTFAALPPKLTGIDNIAWNTDSSAFSYTTGDGRFIYNLADTSIHQFAVGTPTDPRATLWLSPDVFIYAHEGVIWRYDASSQASIKLAQLEGSLSVATPFTLAPDDQTVYFSTSSNEDKKSGAIYSITPNYRHVSQKDQQAMDGQQKRDTQVAVDYKGIDALINNGLSTDQAESFKYALGQYAKQNNKEIKSAQLSEFSMELRRETFDIIRFKLDINDNEHYRAKMDITDISAIRLYLTDAKTNKQVYDSQTIRSQP